MPKLSNAVSDPLASGAVKVTSSTMPKDRIEAILSTPGIFFSDGHFEYPVSDEQRRGNHLDALFIIEPIAENKKYVDWIVEDIIKWLNAQHIEFDAVFAPAQPAVVTIVNALASKQNKRAVFWHYLPSGWFGDKVVSGEVKPGDRVLVFNGVSQQGRCVGDRLPGFVDSLGGQTVAAAVFAIGTASGVIAAQERYGSKLYSTIQVSIGISPADQCKACADGDVPLAWTKLKPFS